MILTTIDLMDVVNWSRAQFAMTAMYHWLFVPLTLGLGFICAIMETYYYKTGDESWKRTTKFWMRIFGINFAVGVATGLILEFQFGTNWSNYSYFVGDIFGAPLAIEGILAFFIEATFISIMFFGWNIVSKGFHLASTWLVAIGANLSALWILVANAWMQYPVGTAFNIETVRNEMTSFLDVLLSPVALNKFFHAVTSGFVLSSVFVIGVSAWYLLKNREHQMAKSSMKIAAVFGLVSSLLLATTGDRSGLMVARTQPMKLAAMEALYDGTTHAPLRVFSILDDKNQQHHLSVEIPSLLSLMSYRSSGAYVAGINDLVNGDPERGILSAAEKIDRGRMAISELTRFRLAKEQKNAEVMDEIKVKFDRNTKEGRIFYSEYMKHFGYGYLSSPTDIVPHVPLVYYSFRIMVLLGIYFIVMFAAVLYMLRKDTVDRRKWFLRTLLWSIPLAYIASQAGWVVAEVGRQPWTIQDILPSVAAVSHIGSTSVIVTFFVFAALFTTLLIAEIRIMTKQIKIGGK